MILPGEEYIIFAFLVLVLLLIVMTCNANQTNNHQSHGLNYSYFDRPRSLLDIGVNEPLPVYQPPSRPPSYKSLSSRSTEEMV
jgi:hypothetical protein